MTIPDAEPSSLVQAQGKLTLRLTYLKPFPLLLELVEGEVVDLPVAWAMDLVYQLPALVRILEPGELQKLYHDPVGNLMRWFTADGGVAGPAIVQEVDLDKDGLVWFLVQFEGQPLWVKKIFTLRPSGVGRDHQ